MRGKCGRSDKPARQPLGRGEREITVGTCRFLGKTYANSLLPVRLRECGGFMCITAGRFLPEGRGVWHSDYTSRLWTSRHKLSVNEQESKY